MAIGDIWGVQISVQTGSIPTLMTAHFQETATIVPDAGIQPAQVLAKSLHLSTWFEKLADCISEDVELLSIYARREGITPAIPFLYVIGAATPNKGGVAGEPVPPQVAAILSLYSDITSRSGRGRMYIVGFPEVDQVEGVMNLAGLTRLNTFAIEAVSAIALSTNGTGEVRQCVYSKVLVGANLVVQATPRTNLGTIRSRRARPGIAP